ncbi:MAG: helix-turn-helix domain-containing protein [Nitrospiraceae bacterium]|nr:helix-turn-helix domain-containing protein [Nitrospiraceae bacterium]
MEKLEKLLNIDEVAEYLGVTKATIYSWTSQKKIPHIKLTKRLLRFREKDIMDWLAQKSVDANASDTGKRNRYYARPSSSLSGDDIEKIIRNAKEEVLKN